MKIAKLKNLKGKIEPQKREEIIYGNKGWVDYMFTKKTNTIKLSV